MFVTVVTMNFFRTDELKEKTQTENEKRGGKLGISITRFIPLRW